MGLAFTRDLPILCDILLELSEKSSDRLVDEDEIFIYLQELYKQGKLKSYYKGPVWPRNGIPNPYLAERDLRYCQLVGVIKPEGIKYRVYPERVRELKEFAERAIKESDI